MSWGPFRQPWWMDGAEDLVHTTIGTKPLEAQQLPRCYHNWPFVAMLFVCGGDEIDQINPFALTREQRNTTSSGNRCSR